MDEQVINLLEKMHIEFKQELNNLKQGQERIEDKQGRIEDKLDAFKSQFEEHEVKDANRHIEILSELKDLHNKRYRNQII